MEASLTENARKPRRKWRGNKMEKSNEIGWLLLLSLLTTLLFTSGLIAEENRLPASVESHFLEEGNSRTVLYPINLEEVLRLAGTGNLTIKEFELRHQLALAEYKKAKEWNVINLYYGAASHNLSGAAMNTDGRISQGIDRSSFWGGIGVAAEWDFSKKKYDALAAKQKADGVKYQSQAEKNQSVLKAVLAFFDLVQEQFKFFSLGKMVDETEALTQQIGIQTEGGFRYQSEYLLGKSNLNHLKISMLQARADWRKKAALLAGLLNLKEDVVLASAEKNMVPVRFDQDFPKSSENATKKRPEFYALQSELLSLKTLKKSFSRGIHQPKLRIAIENAAFGRAFSPISNTFQLNAALIWNIPLNRGAHRGELEKFDKKILLMENETEKLKNQVRREITTAAAELRAAEEQMKLAEEGLKSSYEAMNQSIERQNLGTAKPFEVFQAQQFYQQAQIDYFGSVTTFNKAQYSLFVASGNNL